MSMRGKWEFDSLDDVLAHQIDDLYDAEVRIIKVLPKVVAAAHSRALKDILEKDLLEARQQLRRLDDILASLGRRHDSYTCEAMKGMVKDTEIAASASGDPDAKDALLISAMQRIKHYEIAGYGCARAFAVRLGKRNIADELMQTLREEEAADREMTQIAEAAVNSAALHSR
jgi:ferritin-like metal-binding protein YciE